MVDRGEGKLQLHHNSDKRNIASRVYTTYNVCECMHMCVCTHTCTCVHACICKHTVCMQPFTT